MDCENEYELLSTGRYHPTPGVGYTAAAGTQHPVLGMTHVAVPNKLLKLTNYLAGQPRLDMLARNKPELVWLPNLNFSNISKSVPYILTVHDLSFKIFPEYFSTRMRLWHHGTRPDRLTANAAAIIVPSQATKEDVVRFFRVPESRVHVIPHGVDPMFRPDFETRDHGVRGRLKLPKRFALFVGTLEPRKNIVALADAVEEYRRQSGDDLHLVLAGSFGWKSGAIRERISQKSKVKSQKSNAWIHHLGYIPREDLPALYRAATVFTWPSAYEGFGLPVLEAMASGTPVITSHTSSLPELTGDAAILINPFRPDEIVLALEQLLSSPALQSRLRKAGIEQAKQFSWQKSAEKTVKVFTDVHHPTPGVG
jgi:glycosyltransferase involved in cell wall biosynthesis